MKKILTTILFLCLAATASKAQQLVYLRNGSVVECSVVEQQADDAVKVRLRDGSIFVYPMSVVECIINDSGDSPAGGNDKLRERHKGLDFNLDIGYSVAIPQEDCDKLALHLGLGKRFTRHFYWGVGAGIMMLMADLHTPVIPVTSDFRLYFPIRNKSVVPGGMIRLGYAFNTEKDVVVKMEQYKQVIKAPDFVMLQIMPTVALMQGSKSELVAGVGYTHFVGTVGRKGHGMVTVSFGFNIGTPTTYYRKR